MELELQDQGFAQLIPSEGSEGESVPSLSSGGFPATCRHITLISDWWS